VTGPSAGDHLGRIQPRTGIGIFTASQESTVEDLLRICRCADQVGVDLITIEDHLLSSSGDLTGAQYECWALLSLLAASTTTASIGALVSPVGFRPAGLTAKAAVTLDHISHGRFVLGLGTGWFAAEHREFGFPFPAYSERLDTMAATVRRCREVWSSDRYQPRPVQGDLPVLLGGVGDKMLEAAARLADAWNAEGPIETWSERNAALTRICRSLGRDPGSIVRTVAISAADARDAVSYREAGADIVLLCIDRGTETGELEALLTGAIAAVSPAG
jgi:alkanesulfonate monooxygenase SsuD/methylene tetrahydromethanopterin reductase-like flavin-dependent oxidoreductase (luciferase family)